MFARFTTHKDEEVWINPLHVRMLKQVKRYTEITVGFGLSVIKIEQPAADVAAALDAASPAMVFLPDDGGHDDSAAQIAAIASAAG